ACDMIGGLQYGIDIDSLIVERRHFRGKILRRARLDAGSGSDDPHHRLGFELPDVLLHALMYPGQLPAILPPAVVMPSAVAAVDVAKLVHQRCPFGGRIE